MIRIASRHILSGETITSLDSVCFRDYILERGLAHEVDVYGPKIKESKDLSYVVGEIEDLNDYDIVFCHSSPVNFWGGNVGPYTVKAAERLARYKGQVIHVVNDPRIPAVNWCAKIEGIGAEIASEDVWAMRESMKEYDLCLFSGRDYETWAKHAGGEQAYITQCPHDFTDFFKYVASKSCKRLPILEPHTAEFDLIYYGAKRGGSRQKKLRRYNMKGLFVVGFDVGPPSESRGSVEHPALPYHVRRARASLIIGDEDHDGQWATMRLYEAPYWGVLSFIDLSYDPNKLYYSDRGVQLWCYVNGPEDIRSKLDDLREQPQIYRDLVAAQRKQWGIE